MIQKFIVSIRLRATLAHLVLSALVASSVAILVFRVWYPYPYSYISGGLDLFGILVGVDVTAGPLVTLVIFSPKKSRRERTLDMAVVVALQLGALGYGTWTMHQARPVQLVYEFGQFGVAHAVDVQPMLAAGHLNASDALPLMGPRLKSLRPFHDSAEQASATLMALGGVPLAARADLWQPYEAAIADVLKKSHPLSLLVERHPTKQLEIADAVKKTGIDASQLRYLPLASRGKFWTVLVNAQSGLPEGFLPVDSF